MDKEAYTQEQMNDAKRVFGIIARVPKEKRFLVTIATEAFINGMIAQERLTGQTEAGRDSA